MRKGIVSLITGVAILLVLLLFKTKVGDIRPAILPPSKNVSNVDAKKNQKQQEVGEPVSFPLTLPDNFAIGVFAKNLGKPRDLAFSDRGTLLVSLPSNGSVVALPDRNNDGIADEVKSVASNLKNPHGIAFHKGQLYVVEETRVSRYAWNEDTLLATKEKVLFALPRGGNHTTRTIAFNNKDQMFISLGSTCNVCFEKNEWLAAVIAADEDGNNPRLFAKGLRNAVFITINPKTDELWGTEMGRDFLGDNLPPDEINIIRDGKDYGWPLCYGNKIHDTKFNSSRSKESPCEATETPIYEIAAHSAPLGLTFINSPQFPKEWQGDLLVSYHGSWNRSIPIGYKVVRLDVEGNTIKGESDFLTGFLNGSEARGRPVDLVFDKNGSLYISDDKAGAVYIVGKK